MSRDWTSLTGDSTTLLTRASTVVLFSLLYSLTLVLKYEDRENASASVARP